MHICIARGVHKAGPVYLVDVNAERLKMSADAVEPDEIIDGSEVDVVARVMELTGGRGADVIITATAANISQEQAIAMAARNGRISFFGGLPKTDPTITCDSKSCTTANCTSTAPTAPRPSTTSARWSTSPPARCP